MGYLLQAFWLLVNDTNLLTKIIQFYQPVKLVGEGIAFSTVENCRHLLYVNKGINLDML